MSVFLINVYLSMQVKQNIDQGNITKAKDQFQKCYCMTVISLIFVFIFLVSVVSIVPVVLTLTLT